VYRLDQAVEGVAVPVLAVKRPADVHVKGPGELGGQDLGRGRRRWCDASLWRDTVQVPAIPQVIDQPYSVLLQRSGAQRLA
jgi:hypothetical protein